MNLHNIKSNRRFHPELPTFTQAQLDLLRGLIGGGTVTGWLTEVERDHRGAMTYGVWHHDEDGDRCYVIHAYEYNDYSDETYREDTASLNMTAGGFSWYVDEEHVLTEDER